MDSGNYDEKLKLLSGLAMLLQSCDRETELFDVTYWYLPRLFENTAGRIFLISEVPGTCVPVFSWPPNHTGHSNPDPARCPCLLHGIPMDEGDSGRSACRACGRGAYCLPFREGSESFGVFSLEPVRGTCLSSQVKGLALITTEYLSLAISNIRLKKRLKEMAIRDPLTQLYNRRYMDDVTTREIKKAERSGKPLGMIMIDLDHFKQINDRFGHQAGDEVLRNVAGALVSGVRSEDMVCRFGGEEFFILIPDAGCDDCMKRASDLRAAIKSMAFSCQGRQIGPVTVSAGVAVFPEDGQTLDELLKKADIALYTAKEKGRDRVESAS